jgi:sortase A
MEPAPAYASEQTAGPATARPRERGRRIRRRAGTVLAVVGALLVAYAAVTLLWRDPVTDLYARYQQHRLALELQQEFLAWQTPAAAPQATTSAAAPAPGRGSEPAVKVAVDVAAQRHAVAADARALQARLRDGQPLGRMSIPRLGIDPIFVEGTKWGHDLSRGPGHYTQTALPGLGKTVAVAGHRTTFGAWFRHIDRLRPGDEIVLRMGYATFHYRIFEHRIVENDDWSIIRQRGFDTLVLSACHPLYSASHRYVVFARLVQVEPVRGAPYKVM